MFVPLWMRQCSIRIVHLCIRNWMLLLVLLGIYSFVPKLVFLVHQYLASGKGENVLQELLFENYPLVAVVTFACAWLSLESHACYVRKKYNILWGASEIQSRIAHIAGNAKLAFVPPLLVLKDGARVCTAARHSLCFARSVVIPERMLFEARTAEQDAFLAQQIAHFKHGDSFALVLMCAGSRALSMQKWLLAGMVPLMMIFGTEDHVTSAFVLWFVLVLIHFLYKLGEAGHARGREFLADMGAIAIRGWWTRSSFVSSLQNEKYQIPAWSPFPLLGRTRLAAFLTLPRVHERAEALSITIMPNGCWDTGILD